MPTIGAIANGPILFTQSNGSQLSIPTDALSFTGGQLDTPPLPFTVADSWLRHLVSTGFIKEEPPHAFTVTAPPPPVLTLTAASPGVWGNNILMAITYGVGQTDYTITVSATVTLDLDTATLAQALGTAALAADRPGPVLVGATIVAGSTPLNTTTPLALGSSPLVIDTIDSSGTAFTLVARRTPPGGNPITVAISNAVAGSSHFTLTLGWTGTSSALTFAVPTGSALSTIRSALTASVGYLVDVVYNGGKPKSGPFALTGGADGARAQTSTPLLM